LKRPHPAPDVNSRAADAAAIAAALWHVSHDSAAVSPAAEKRSRWKMDGHTRQTDRTP
jgi:hypothetical protein